jgi:hypothetical protein
METSIKKEFEQRAIDYVNDGILTIENQDDWHYHLFNEDYYIIGYYESEQWLKEHGVSPFEAIGTIQDYDIIEVGFGSSEAVVNAYVYILGEEWMYEYGEEFINQLLNQ